MLKKNFKIFFLFLLLCIGLFDSHKLDAAVDNGGSRILKETDHHRILGLSPRATPEDVKKAYRSLAMRYHPDRHPSASPTDQATYHQIFAKISEAYTNLKTKVVSKEPPAEKATAESNRLGKWNRVRAELRKRKSMEESVELRNLYLNSLVQSADDFIELFKFEMKSPTPEYIRVIEAQIIDNFQSFLKYDPNIEQIHKLLNIFTNDNNARAVLNYLLENTEDPKKFIQLVTVKKNTSPAVWRTMKQLAEEFLPKFKDELDPSDFQALALNARSINETFRIFNIALEKIENVNDLLSLLKLKKGLKISSVFKMDFDLFLRNTVDRLLQLNPTIEQLRQYAELAYDPEKKLTIIDKILFSLKDRQDFLNFFDFSIETFRKEKVTSDALQALVANGVDKFISLDPDENEVVEFKKYLSKKRFRKATTTFDAKLEEYRNTPKKPTKMEDPSIIGRLCKKIFGGLFGKK